MPDAGAAGRSQRSTTDEIERADGMPKHALGNAARPGTCTEATARIRNTPTRAHTCPQPLATLFQRFFASNRRAARNFHAFYQVNIAKIYASVGAGLKFRQAVI